MYSVYTKTRLQIKINIYTDVHIYVRNYIYASSLHNNEYKKNNSKILFKVEKFMDYTSGQLHRLSMRKL